MVRRRLLAIAVVIVVVVGVAAYMLLEEPGESIQIREAKIIIYDPNNPNYLIQSEKGKSYVDGPVNQSMRLRLTYSGPADARIYMFSHYDRNFTFNEDIVLPPSVDFYVYYPTSGGPLAFKIVRTGDGGRGPTGGTYAFSTDSITGYALDTSTAVTVYTRAGNTFALEHIRTGIYVEGD